MFALYDADTSEPHKILMRAWTMLTINSVLSLSPDKDFRFVVSADEIPVLGPLNGIDEAVALGRKRGFVGLLGFQNRPQLRQIYGKDVTESILGCAGTKIIQDHFSDIDEARKAAEENYCGRYKSLADYAEELTDQTTQIPESLAYYIDYEKMGRDMELGGDVFTIETSYEEVHIFWNH